MSVFDMSQAQPLGGGLYAPASSVLDLELAKLLMNYKKSVASRYRALTNEELSMLPDGKLYVSPKIDGEAWYLFAEQGEGTAGKEAELALVSPNGKVIKGDIPLLDEARKTLLPRVKGRVILAGELFALRKGGRPRVGDLAAARSGGADAETSRIGFHAFDVLDAEKLYTEDADYSRYAARLELLQMLCEGGKRLQAIKTEVVTDVLEVKALWDEWVCDGKGEGLVVRSEAVGRTFKVKPSFSIDAVVVGYTERADEDSAVRSLLLAVMREGGQLQLIGSCGNMPGLEYRQALFSQLEKEVVPSTYSYASSSGALFRFVKPSLVVEIKVTDIQSEDSAGKPIKRMVLEARGDEGYVAAGPMTGVSILHPVLVRIRDDKEVNEVDIRAAQVLERVFVEDVDEAAVRKTLPASEIIRREVYTKETKGKVAVRKLVVWRTNKHEESGGQFPRFVAHFTDYSSGRKSPLANTVRLGATEEQIAEVADELIEKNIKRGWNRVDA